MFDAKELLNMLTGGQPPAGAENAANDTSAALDRGKQIASDAANQAASTISNVLGQLQSRLKGSETSDYAGKAKDFVDKNPIGAVAALGGLTALLLGTKGGRAATGELPNSAVSPRSAASLTRRSAITKKASR